MTGPSTTNTVAQILDDLISGSVDAAARLGETAAEGYEPILALPIIKQLFEYFVGRLLVDFGSVPLQEAMTALVIHIQTAGENADCVKSFAAFQAAQAKGDPNEIAQAKTNLDSAFTSLIQYDGSASPITSSP